MPGRFHLAAVVLGKADIDVLGEADLAPAVDLALKNVYVMHSLIRGRHDGQDTLAPASADPCGRLQG